MDHAKNPFEEVAESIRRGIRAGTYEVGERLPSIRSLAAKFDVSEGTAQRAMDLLRQEGVVSTRLGSGSKVVAIPSEPPSLEALAEELDALKDRVSRLEQDLE